MPEIPRITATLDDAGQVVYIDGTSSVPDVDVDPIVAAREAFRCAALAASFGEPGAQAALEQAERELEALERQARRDQAAREAAREKASREAAERRAAKEAEARRQQDEARGKLDLLEPKLVAAAKEFAELAGQAMSLGTEAYNGTHANQGGHVAAVLKTAIFNAGHGRSREWLLSELGGRPSARDRGL